MASSWGSALVCCCGLTYPELRTGYTFALVRQEMHRASDDPADWRYRRRNGVLGYWHRIKRRLWASHVDACYTAQDTANAHRVFSGPARWEPPEVGAAQSWHGRTDQYTGGGHHPCAHTSKEKG